MANRVELFTTAKGGSLSKDDEITIRIGLATATLTAGEWSRLIANPQHKPPRSMLTDHAKPAWLG